MRITKELKSYVTSKVEEILVPPVSEQVYNDLKCAAQDAEKAFTEFVQKTCDTYVEGLRETDTFKDCVFKISSAPQLRIGLGTTEAYKAYTQEYGERDKFKNSTVDKIIALLSTMKTVDNLDEFIVQQLTI